jgi:hypothetical protein
LCKPNIVYKRDPLTRGLGRLYRFAIGWKGQKPSERQLMPIAGPKDDRNHPCLNTEGDLWHWAGLFHQGCASRVEREEEACRGGMPSYARVSRRRAEPCGEATGSFVLNVT